MQQISWSMKVSGSDMTVVLLASPHSVLRLGPSSDVLRPERAARTWRQRDQRQDICTHIKPGSVCIGLSTAVTSHGGDISIYVYERPTFLEDSAVCVVEEYHNKALFLSLPHRGRIGE